MKKLLNQKEQHIAFTREKAEEIVTTAKENDALIMNKISEKHNKNGQYFLVDLTYQYDTPKDAMEGKKNDVPEGQLSTDDIEGIEYTVEKDGSVSIVDGQPSDEEVDAIEFVEVDAEENGTPDLWPYEDDKTNLPF